ncbi:hypothetical protein GF312_06345 [Candidatus Poribacteria bacterium]|nr:hypothetical protein [Candidatus Poribacteria bacterium]
MSNVKVITPSRVHMALIDLNGNLGRIDGGIGLSLSNPGFSITARKADHNEIICSPDIKQRAGKILDALKEKCGIDNVKINIEKSIPFHSGLGSGTQLSLGIAQAACKLNGLEYSPQQLAYIVGRGGTSGIGVAAFSQGGFIVDGGHTFSDKKNNSEKTSYLPSSASKGVKPPPVIARYDFPEWDVLITIPNCKHISGDAEVKLFKTLCPMPLEEVQALSHIILMKLLPSLIQQELQPFGEAIDLIQTLAWKKVELQHQDPIVMEIMTFLRENGGHGVGLSSWGPAVFCFGENLAILQKRTREFLGNAKTGGTCFLTKANNTGTLIIEDENGFYEDRSEKTDLQRAVYP